MTKLPQEPFRQYNLPGEKKKEDTFTVKFDKSGFERNKFDILKQLIQQEKDSTAIKQLAWIGAEVILDKKMLEFTKIIMNNYRKNKRLGIVNYQDSLQKYDKLMEKAQKK